MAVVVDAQEKRVIDVEARRGVEAAETFAAKLEEKSGSYDAIRFVASDMSAAYLKVREDWFPQAESVIDRFHVKKLVLEGMEQVRRAELGTGKYSRSMANQKKLLTIPSGRLTVSQAERVEARARSAPKQGERTGWSRPWIACTEAWNCRQPKGAWMNSSPGCATAAWSQ